MKIQRVLISMLLVAGIILSAATPSVIADCDDSFAEKKQEFSRTELDVIELVENIQRMRPLLDTVAKNVI